VLRLIWDAVVHAPATPALHLLSSLAEGADCLVAQEALQLGYELHAVLPFARHVYAEDFVTPEARQTFAVLLGRAWTVRELPGAAQDRPAAYLAAGRYLLAHCQLLLTLWDGLPAKGEGGTGQIVAEAGERHLMTVWVDARPPHAARLLLGDGTGAVTAPLGALAEQVRQLLHGA
jgi:hypothetical protein